MKLFQDFLFVSLCLALCGLFSSMATAKPLSPVQVSIEPLQPAVQGQPVEFVVRAIVSMDAENLRIVVSVPPLVKITSGESQWQGELLKGEEKQLRFTALAGGSAVHTIEARAYIIAGDLRPDGSQNGVNPDGHFAQFSAAAVYSWSSGVASVAATQALPLNSSVNSRIVERAGRKVAEYELRP